MAQVIVLTVGLLFAGSVFAGTSNHFDSQARNLEQLKRSCPGKAHPQGQHGDLYWCFENLHLPQVRAERYAAFSLGAALFLPFANLLVLWIWLGRPSGGASELPS